MPAGFDKCVGGGGRVRTRRLSGGRYMHICFKGGKSHAGYVKKKGVKRKMLVR
jgi:predicted NAD/FAD-dependent oxidoreductase